MSVKAIALALVMAGALSYAPAAQVPDTQRPFGGLRVASSDVERRKAYDEILDTYVRDGLVYYRALKSERARLDSYVSALAAIDADTLPQPQQIALWLNGYNALVLKTVIDHYPIPKRAAQYPPHSIRQIPGAFERTTHRIGGRTMTLDQIEQTVLAGFHDPRLFFAIARGSLDGGRLRSEAFSPDRLEAQLTEVQNECTSRPGCVQIDRAGNKILASSIFSWREKEFAAAYAANAPRLFTDRSPIERAILTYIQPKLLTTEKEFLAGNTFTVAFKPYDWSLNDLTGRGGR